MGTLSKALGSYGGYLCASRPVVDQGWLPTSCLVGKSGKRVKPKVYLALGISGAPDGYGDKSTMIFIVIVSIFVFMLISAAPFQPQLINMPGPRTPAKIQVGPQSG